MLISRFIIISWVATYSNVHKNTSVFFLHLKHCVLASISFRPHFLNTQSGLIGQLAHAWASTANKNRAAVLNQLLHPKLATRYILRKHVTWQISVISKSQNQRQDYWWDSCFGFFAWERSFCWCGLLPFTWTEKQEVPTSIKSLWGHIREYQAAERYQHHLNCLNHWCLKLYSNNFSLSQDLFFP